MRKKELIENHEEQLKSIFNLIPAPFKVYVGAFPDVCAYDEVYRSVRNLVNHLDWKFPNREDTNTVEMRLRALECDGHEWEYIDNSEQFNYNQHFKRCRKCKKTELIGKLDYLQGMIDFSEGEIEKYTKELDRCKKAILVGVCL